MEINCTKSSNTTMPSLPSLLPAPVPPVTSLAELSSNNSPCAACKFLRRKCQPKCVFAPYFPPDDPQKFVNVHRVFGASNVAKLINHIDGAQKREYAANSLAYEARMRLHDPVRGCVGIIADLEYRLKQVQIELARARAELSRYLTPTTTTPAIMLGGGMDGGVSHGIAGCGSKEQYFAAASPLKEEHHYMNMIAYDPQLTASHPIPRLLD